MKIYAISGLGAINFFNETANKVKNQLTGEYDEVPKVQRAYKADYDKIQEDDKVTISDLTSFAPGKPLTMVFTHKDGSSDTIMANHTYNAPQIEWFKEGGALNIIHKQFAG